MQACGACDPGSIPGGSTRSKKQTYLLFRTLVRAGAMSRTCGTARQDRAAKVATATFERLTTKPLQDSALVVQWIGCLPPKEAMQVRFLPRAPQTKTPRAGSFCLLTL